MLPFGVCRLAAKEDLEIKHIDIQCAFLNGKLEEEMYVEQPPFFNGGTTRVWKLHKTLCGMKQATREWYKALVEVLSELAFECSDADAGLCVKRVGRVFIFPWVDVLFIFALSSEMQDVVGSILRKFQGRGVGDLAWALGCKITRDGVAKTITGSQSSKMETLLEKSAAKVQHAGLQEGT